MLGLMPGNVVDMDEVVVFDAGDEPYRSWLSANPRGFVLNVARDPKSSYLKLHRPWCGYIAAPRKPGAYTERQYIKICAARREALEDWARRTAGGRLDPGCSCN
jgi:hypothetical protein